MENPEQQAEELIPESELLNMLVKRWGALSQAIGKTEKDFSEKLGNEFSVQHTGELYILMQRISLLETTLHMQTAHTNTLLTSILEELRKHRPKAE